MKLIGKFIIHVIANMIALLAANYFVSGFSFSGDFYSLVVVSALFALIQMVIKPILRLFSGPLIVLTFGLFSIVVNAILLYILDILSSDLTIQGYVPLLLGTLIVSIAHMVISGAGRKVYKE